MNNRFERLFNAVAQDDEMKDQYDQYLKDHISNVSKGFGWLYKNMPEIFESFDADYLGDLIVKHDDSKYDVIEYYPYCEYFYGVKTPEVEEEFDYAWLHHQHNNPHHWQHWLLREDNGNLKPLEMPYEYVIEMVCDWWAFSWKKDDLYEIFKWYEQNKPKQLLHAKTQKDVEYILEKLKNKLDDLNGYKK